MLFTIIIHHESLIVKFVIFKDAFRREMLNQPDLLIFFNIDQKKNKQGIDSRNIKDRIFFAEKKLRKCRNVR